MLSTPCQRFARCKASFPLLSFSLSNERVQERLNAGKNLSSGPPWFPSGVLSFQERNDLQECPRLQSQHS